MGRRWWEGSAWGLRLRDGEQRSTEVHGEPSRGPRHQLEEPPHPVALHGWRGGWEEFEQKPHGWLGSQLLRAPGRGGEQEESGARGTC